MRQIIVALCLLSFAACDSESWSPTAPDLTSKATTIAPTRRRAARPAPVEPPVLEPACASPKPLVGTWDPRASGYIVVLREGANAPVVVPWLEQKYGFQAIRGYYTVIPAFFAYLSPELVAALRCDYDVRWIEYNASGEFSGTKRPEEITPRE